MAKRIGIIAFLLCFCVFLMPQNVYAVSTTNAQEEILTDKECSLTITYNCDSNAFSQLPVRLYKIAQVSNDYQYTLTSSFKGSALLLNGIRTTDEWNTIRSTLESYILANNIQADYTANTDELGNADFKSLKPALYLAITENTVKDETTYIFDSALVALPSLNEQGTWQYVCAVNAKSQIIPPTDEEKEIQLKVLKLWKDDNTTQERPKSVEIEIFKNGTSYQKVTLSVDNNWTYNWAVIDDGSDWKVVERNIPSEYTVTIEERGTSFVVTNTLISDITDSSSSPHTGESHNVMLYVTLMFLIGIILIALGCAGKRKSL